MKKLLIASAIIAILAISCNHEFPDRKTKLTAVNQTFTTHGNLQVIGTQLSDGNGDPVQLRGMSTHGLQYRGDCYNEASLDLLTDDWGVDILRISMYVQEGGYEDDPVFFTKFVDSLVGECYDRGIYALIDWHMLHPGDPNANTALAKVFFEHVSEEHADKGNVLYEICNEPNNDNYTVTWPMIKNYAEEIIPIIRNNDPNSVIIVGHRNLLQDRIGLSGTSSITTISCTPCISMPQIPGRPTVWDTYPVLLPPGYRYLLRNSVPRMVGRRGKRLRYVAKMVEFSKRT